MSVAEMREMEMKRVMRREHGRRDRLYEGCDAGAGGDMLLSHCGQGTYLDCSEAKVGETGKT